MDITLVDEVIVPSVVVGDMTYQNVVMTEFHYFADGARPVMRILVDQIDQIWVAPMFMAAPSTYEGEYPNDMEVLLNAPQLTKGSVHRHKDDALADEGVTLEYICLGAIASYVVPRIGTLMARCYVPKDVA